jgi:hypothetical protein
MKNTNQFLAVGGVALVLVFAGVKALGQDAGGGGGGGFGGGGGGGFGGGGGGFDPTQIVPMMAEGMRTSLLVTNDDEWKIISLKLQKVIQLQMEERLAGMGAMMRNRGGGPGGGGGGGMRFFGALGGTPDPSEDALQKALDDNAPTAQLKAAMAKLRVARKQKQEEKAKAQAELRDLLTIRQEALLLTEGLLD